MFLFSSKGSRMRHHWKIRTRDILVGPAAKKLSVFGAGRKKLSVWGPLGTIWDLWGPSGDHLGNGFDEVIDFITEPDLPECADRSVSSKRVPRKQCSRKVVVGKIQISKNRQKKTKNSQNGHSRKISYKILQFTGYCRRVLRADRAELPYEVDF